MDTVLKVNKKANTEIAAITFFFITPPFIEQIFLIFFVMFLAMVMPVKAIGKSFLGDACK